MPRKETKMDSSDFYAVERKLRVAEGEILSLRSDVTDLNEAIRILYDEIRILNDKIALLASPKPPKPDDP